MSKEIKEMLNDEIKTTFDKLKWLSEGTKERESAIKDLDTLYQLSLDEEKLDLEAEIKNADRGEASKNALDEARLKEAQFKDQKKDRYFRVGMEAAGIILPLVFYGIWYHDGLKFEETGTFTSTTLRGLFSQFKAKNRG